MFAKSSMTYPFETENIFYVPPGKPFRLYDLLGWRRIDFHIQSTRLVLDAAAGSAIRERAGQALKAAQSDDEPLDMAREKARMEEFLSQLPFADGPADSTRELEDAFLPLRPLFWARLSQQPMESFFHEDYEETPVAHPSPPSTILSCVGAVAFNALGPAECELPSSNPHTLRLCARTDVPVIDVSALDPFEPLPLIREYCGLLGSSNQAELVTIDLQARIPEASLAAIPIRRSGSTCYETLYFSVPLETQTPPLRAFRPDQIGLLAAALRAKGFEPKRRTKRFGAWVRGQDVVQVYRDLPGKESEVVPVLPPFCLAAWADGSTDRAARHALLNEILGRGR